MNKKLIATSILTLLSLPAVILAVFNTGTVPNSVNTLSINTLLDAIFGIIWPIAVGFFVIMFIIAAFRFGTAGADATKVSEARNYVIWGVVGVLVALLAFSLPFVVRNLLNTNGINVGT